jgi:hypothetical protein
MGTEYDVKVKLRVEGAERAQKSVEGLAGRMHALGANMAGIKSPMQGMARQAIAMGAAYVGFSAGVGAFKSLSMSAIKYTADLEASKIGLTSVMSAVNKVPWEEGVKQADGAFDVLKQMATLSPAGPKDMFDIFTGIIGPLRGAGMEMSKIYDVTNSTVLAASALGVDYAQASRDISAMARGAAGMDVKMFALMNSTGAIKENAEEWNHSLTGAERAVKIQEALGKFASSGAAFGKSWTGTTSTFSGIVDEAKRAFTGPVLGVLAGKLGKVNDYLTANGAKLENWASIYGSRVGEFLGRAADSAGKAFTWVIEHAGDIQARLTSAFEVFKTYAPMIARTLATLTALDFGKSMLGKGLMVGAQVAGMVGGGGAGAAGAGAQAAGAAGAAGGAGLGAVALPLAGLASIAVAVYENFKPLAELLEGPLSAGASKAQEVLTTAFSVIYPVLNIIGDILLAYLVPAFLVLSTWLTKAWELVKPLIEVLASLAKVIAYEINQAFQWFLEVIDGVGAALDPVIALFDGFTGTLQFLADRFSAFTDGVISDAEKLKRTDAQARWDAQEGVKTNKEYKVPEVRFDMAAVTANLAGAKVPAARGGSTVNVAKMIIQQDFKNADPDRVVAKMLSDITKQAESRISSRFSGALTR